MEAERHVSKVINAPSIPVTGKNLLFRWIAAWAAAVFICLASVPLIRPFIFAKQWVEMPDSPVDLTMEIAGCDVQIATSSHISGSWIRMQHWRTQGTGKITKVSEEKFHVEAKMTRKMASFPCKIQVLTNPAKERLFKNLTVKIEKDDWSNFNPGPSNVAELAEVVLSDFKVEKKFTLEVKTNTETILYGARVGDDGEFIATIQGGKLELHECADPAEGDDPACSDDKYTKEPYLPQKMDLTLNAATVIIASRNNNLKAHIQNDTVDDAILAGASVENTGTDGSLVSFTLDKGSAGNDVDVTLSADNCAIYLSAYDKEFWSGDDDSHPLDVVTGDSAKDVSLLPDGEHSLHQLSDWLGPNGSHNSKWVVYIQLTAPSVPAGTFRLLSTSSYMALSMSTFSLISGGMLTPEIVRIVTPIKGFDWLFPRRKSDGPISKTNLDKFSMESFKTLIKYVDFRSLKLPQAVWIWDPPGPEFDIFDYITKKKEWRMRPVGSSETFMFQLASAITLGLGLLVGGAACAAIFYLLIPKIKSMIRDQILTNAGSYQLSCMIPVTDWKVPAAMVRYPIEGILMRWNTRDDMAQFSKMAIRARKWPADDTNQDITVDKIDPWRLPTLPENPAQQVFLFATNPPAKAPKRTPAFKKLFDMELYGTAMQCCKTPGLPLHVGQRYQFRIDAYGGGNTKTPMEKSEWTRPLRIQSKQVFTDLPFILWKVICGVIPDDSFAYFLAKHCLPIGTAPSLQIHISNMKLCLVNDSVLFMGKGGEYGQDIEVSDMQRSFGGSGVLTGQQFVEIQASTGNSVEELTMADTMFEKTHDFLLPGLNSDKRKKCQSLSEIMEGKKESARTHGMDKMKFLVMDLNKLGKKHKEALTLNVGLDLTQTVRIETVVIEDEKGQDKQSARYEDTWKEFISAILHAEKASGGCFRLIDELVMRDGLTPAAMLMADCELMNSAISGSLKKANPGKLPNVFAHVIPGMTFIWGETLPLSWNYNLSTQVPEPGFDILLVSEDLPHVKDNKEHLLKDDRVPFTLVVMDVQFAAEKVSVPMTPKQPYAVCCMRCHLEIRFHKEHTKVAASSDEFVILRPVTQQNLELGYAAFCARNDIPMNRVEKGKLTPFYGIEILEKAVNVCMGYRQPLPITHTGEPEEGLINVFPEMEGQPLVKNPDSYVIVDPHGLVVPQDGAEISKLKEKKRKYEENKKKGLMAKLTAVLDAEKGPDEAIPTKAVPARSELLDLLTNVFWKKESSWEEEVLLCWWLVPFFADGGWIEGKCRLYNQNHLAEVAVFMDQLVRAMLQTVLYLGQLAFLFFPGFVALYVIMKIHSLDSTVNPNMGGSDNLQSVALTQIISPSLFTYRSLANLDLWCYWFILIYFIVLVLATFYGNFLHNKHYMKPVHLVFNTIVSTVVTACFYLIVVYLCVVLVWILMGSMIDPGSVMPYALLFVGSLFIATSVWTKTSGYRAQILKQMEDKLDLVTHAVMGIFVDDADPDDGPNFKGMVDDICELMRQGEGDVTKKLFEQGDIEGQVLACDRDLVLKLRESDEFKVLGCVKDEEGNPGVPDQCMSTDFVPQACWKPAQVKSNDDATIANTRSAPDKYGTVPDEKLSPEALAWALAQQGLDGLGDPLKVNKEDAEQVGGIAKQIGLRPNTAELVHKSFSLAVAKANDPTLSNAFAMQQIFSSIRMDQLFKHFVYAEEPNPDGKGKGKIKSTALAFLKDLEKKDLLNLDAALAQALSKFCYWPDVSRKVAKFAATSIRDSVTFAIDNQLNPVMEDTAAFKVRIKACDCLYTNFEKVYKSNYMKFFIDVGIVEEKFSETEECKSMMSVAVGSFLNFDGSLDPSGLMKAVDWLCFPATRSKAQGEGSGQLVLKNYFWYDALVLTLKQLGWNDEEMEESWLQSRWLELTEKKGILAYTVLEEVNALISVGFADGGLWKSAVKAIMLNVKLGGYVGCNLERDGMEKTAKTAHTVALGDQTDLKFLNENLRWPDLMQDLWDDVACPSRGGKDAKDGERPNFLELVRIDKFLQSIIYLPDVKDKDTVKRSQLNPLAVADLQWYKGDDGGLWDGDGGSSKRIRGIWLELLIEVFDILECFPTDLDLFYKCQEWQKNQGTDAKWLQYSGLRWLDSDYLAGKEANTATLTANELSLLLKNYMNCDLPADVLKSQVFGKCKWVPDDDLGELRYLKDCAAALRYWMGYGLWKGAIEQTIMFLMPRSNLRRLALQCLSAEFDKMDTANIGIVQPGQAVALLRKLTHPGLTCPELGQMLKENLSLDIPERELHKYFTMNDVNGDGVLQVGEFVCTCRYLMTNYYPGHIMRNMKLSIWIIIGIIIGVVATLVAVFVCVTLVVKTFTSGSVGHAVHSGVSGMSVAAMKLKSDSQVGADDAVSAVRAKIDETLTVVVCSTLGLSTVAADKLTKMSQELKAG